MAFKFLFKSIPSAVRLSLAGGTAYGSAKIGVWSDSSKSRDKLREMRKSLYEIEYPAVSKYTKYSHPATSPELSINKGASSRLSTSYAAKIWNSAIKRMCQLAIRKANNSEHLHISVSKLSQYLKKWTDK